MGRGCRISITPAKLESVNERPAARTHASAGLNLSLGDVYHILFRHKWKILLIAGAGILGALLLPLLHQAPYTSEAKLYIRYVLESSTPTPDANDPRIKLPDNRGDSIVNTELEILTSLDLAQEVADTIGAEKILGPGGRDRFQAGTVVRKGLTAEVPKNSSVIRLSFQHANPEIVRPVLQQVIDFYFKKHTEMHAVGAFDDFLTQETDQLRSDLAKTEHDLDRAKTNLGYYASLEDAKKFQGEQISKIRQSIFDAEAELAERKAAAEQLTGHVNESPDTASNRVALVSAEKFADYREIVGRLENLRKREENDSIVFTRESARIKSIRQQISETVAAKAELEKENPGLLMIGVSDSRHLDGTQSPRANLSAETARVGALSSKIAVLNAQLERLQKEAAAVGSAEGTITKLQLQKEIEEGRYRHFVKGLEQARIDEKIGSGKAPNLKLIQKPSPPFRDGTKLQKARIGIIAGALVVAIGLAFILELFVDRTVKHAAEIESKFGLPLFLTIPLLHERRSRWPLLKNVPLLSNGNGHRNGKKSLPEPKPMLPIDETKADSLDDVFNGNGSRLPLRPFFEALRDRLISYFEIKNLTHKPKLVAVTSCREGSGVSTFAAGLAASLSETGEGNVLLVDMSKQNGSPKQFIGGRLHCGLDDALEREKRDTALVQENLYVVTESGNGHANGKLSRILPKRFTNLVPKLKASDYDYIIFDMPPVSQLSVTPRVAKFMDIMLVVAEAEKTDREVFKRAITMLAESKANLGAVLNKRRSYVPTALQQEI
jgi:succinoglycan biosynthesis transport protein ExoP